MYLTPSLIFLAALELKVISIKYCLFAVKFCLHEVKYGEIWTWVQFGFWHVASSSDALPKYLELWPWSGN